MEDREDAHGGVPTTWLAPHRRRVGTVVFLHGGAYTLPPNDGQRAWLAEVAEGAGLAGALVRYRRPPAHPYPAALDDAVGAVTTMAAAGLLAPGRWVLAGDSAGGGLALATAQALRDRGTPLPAGLVLSAPWVDLDLDPPAAPDDAPVQRRWLRRAARTYADGAPLDDPGLSPLHGELAGLPPVHLDVGRDDLLRPDVLRLREELDGAGVDVELRELAGGFHAPEPRLDPDEVAATVAAQVAFVRRVVGRG